MTRAIATRSRTLNLRVATPFQTTAAAAACLPSYHHSHSHRPCSKPLHQAPVFQETTLMVAHAKVGAKTTTTSHSPVEKLLQTRLAINMPAAAAAGLLALTPTLYVK